MANSEQPLILVADDEPSTLALVANHLRGREYRVIEATDGDEAWDLACRELPDLVVLDVMMPGMSGWEVCRKIREAVSLAHTGVIMLTGIGDTLNELTSPLYGADAYLDKPFQFQKLQELVGETLKSRRRGNLGRPEKTAGPSTRLFKSSLSDDAPESTIERRPRSEAPAAEKPSAKKNGSKSKALGALTSAPKKSVEKAVAESGEVATPKPPRKARSPEPIVAPPAKTDSKTDSKSAAGNATTKGTAKAKPGVKTVPATKVSSAKSPADKSAAKTTPKRAPKKPAPATPKAPAKPAVKAARNPAPKSAPEKVKALKKTTPKKTLAKPAPKKTAEKAAPKTAKVPKKALAKPTAKKAPAKAAPKVAPKAAKAPVKPAPKKALAKAAPKVAPKTVKAPKKPAPQKASKKPAVKASPKAAKAPVKPAPKKPLTTTKKK